MSCCTAPCHCELCSLPRRHPLVLPPWPWWSVRHGVSRPQPAVLAAQPFHVQTRIRHPHHRRRLSTHTHTSHCTASLDATATSPLPADPSPLSASAGIGRAVALTYARRLCHLVLVDIDSASVATTASQCQSLFPPPSSASSSPSSSSFSSSPSSTLPLTVDVTSPTAVSDMMQRCIERYAQLDILVLCAGIGAHHLFASTTDLSLFHRLMDVNFWGYLHCTHAAYPHLCRSHGTLVAITSFSGEVGLPYRTAYCASKFATTGLLEALRSEMRLTGGEAFDIVIVCPPTVATNLRKNSLTPDPSLREAGEAGGGVGGAGGGGGAMSVEECARAIVDAADRRLRKAFFPFNSWLASYLRPIIPDVMDALILRRAKL